jgi:hypothetical protein
MEWFLSHSFFKELLALGLPVDDYALAGSAPLYVRRLVDRMGDLDVVARGKAWTMATALGEPKPAPHSITMVVKYRNLEILNGWFPDEGWDTDALIDGADVIGGLRFVTLDVVRWTNRYLGRTGD